VTPVRARAGTDDDLRRLCDAAAADFAAYRRGDRPALDRLVRRLTPMLWQVARAYRLDQASSEDVVQATWLTLVRHADAVTDPQAVVRWLTVTTRREAWRCAKANARVDATVEDVIDLRDGEETPEEVTVRAERDGALWRAVEQLSERCQRLLRIVAFADRPDYSAIARELQMPVGSIGPTRGRCLGKLRVLLDESGWRTA
jgi:RNA polymerase sigma factor (sigma-70 family)